MSRRCRGCAGGDGEGAASGDVLHGFDYSEKASGVGGARQPSARNAVAGNQHATAEETRVSRRVALGAALTVASAWARTMAECAAA